jgi:5-methylcytosine-specific restriction protein A
MPSNPYYHTKHWKVLRERALKRDRYRCTTPGCGQRATIVDHRTTRPPSPAPTAADTINNLRSLCRGCDNQVKELHGKRKGNGTLKARGCDADGMPMDPNHPWHTPGGIKS